MARMHALGISLLLAACAVTGATAAMKTIHLGATAAKPPHVADRIVAARRAKLDRFAATLAQARRSQPPALPKVPHYAPVHMPTPPPASAPRVLAAAPLPAPVAAPAPAPAAPKVRYVRPAPIVKTVQAPPTTTQQQPGWGDDNGGDDNGGGGWGGDDGGGD